MSSILKARDSMLRFYTFILTCLLSLSLGCNGALFTSASSSLSLAVKDTTELPTFVVTGDSITAYFTLTNATDYAQDLVITVPENVTQVTSDGTYEDTCPVSFRLNVGEQCTLQVSITGAVSTDQVISICQSNTNLCVQNNDLSINEIASITLTPLTQYFHINNTQQYTATATLTDESTTDVSSIVTWQSSNTDAATISSSGLATAVALGSSEISLSLGTYTSSALSFNVVGERVYIANRTLGSVSLCSLQSSTGDIIDCSDSGAGTIFSNPIGIALSVDKNFLYVGNTANHTVTVCAVNQTDGTLSDCATSGSGFVQPTHFDFNSSGTKVYIANNGNDTVSACSVDEDDGSLSDCQTTAGGVDILTANGIAIDNNDSFAYIPDLNSNAVYVCPIEETGLFGTCVDSGQGATFSNTTTMIFNSDASQAYINEGFLTLCDVDSTSGGLSNCVDSGLGALSGLGEFVFNDTYDKLYLTRSFFTIYEVRSCDVSSETGLLSNCADAAGDGSASFTSPTGIALW